MGQFAIHEANLERLQKKVQRIRNKCIKFGCEFTYEEKGEEFRTYTDADGNETVTRYIIVEASGTAKVNGWEFAATIDHTEAGNIIRKFKEDVEVPERYYSCDPDCEHCHSKRHRKDTYLVYNTETQEFKQVGSSCVNDFTAGLSAEAIAQYISFFDELIEGETPYPGSSFQRYELLTEVLKYANIVVDHIGYVSTSASEFGGTSTRSFVTDLLDYHSFRRTSMIKSLVEDVEDFLAKYNPDFDSKENLQKVQAIIKHFREVDDSKSDYLHNLKVIANSEYITMRNMGYAVSMVSAYNRDLEIQTQKAKAAVEHADEVTVSGFLGTVGERIVINNVASVTAITSWSNQYGETIRYKIVDTDGNVIMWDSSTGIYSDRPVVSITGTVKKHDEFRDVKQTWLTRCRVTYGEKKPEETPADGTFDIDKVFAAMNNAS